MAELADALDSGSSSSNIVQVRPLLPAPKQYNPNQIFPVGDGFGLFVYFERFEDTHFKNGIIKRPNSKPRGPRKKKTILIMEDLIMKKLISCEFNFDTVCVELKFNDGSMIAIDTIAVENVVARNMYERSELDYLIYNAPLEYADFIALWRPL